MWGSPPGLEYSKAGKVRVWRLGSQVSSEKAAIRMSAVGNAWTNCTEEPHRGVV